MTHPKAMLLSLCCLVLLARASTSVEITELHQESSTLNTITLGWTLSSPDATVDQYTLLVDGLINQFKPSGENTHTVIELLPCTEHDFVLTATAGGVESEPASTTGSTSYETPGAISSLTVNGDKTLLEWTAPANEECVAFYEVCWRSQVLSQDFCDTSTTTSYALTSMGGCDTLKATVTAVSGGTDDLRGPTSEPLTFGTAFGEPGKPRDLVVEPLPDFAAKLTWNLPEENPACIADDVLTYGPYEEQRNTRGDVTTRGASLGVARKIDNEAMVFNLTACTNMLFDVSFMSVQDTQSESAYDNFTTDYIPPGAITDVTFDATTDTVTLTWNELLDSGCLAYIEICYTDASTKKTVCLNETNPELDKKVVITGLEACRHYEFAVAGVSVTGEFGPPTTHEVTMLDLAPGPVQNLRAESVSVSSVMINYDPPVVRPECVVEYVIKYTQILPEPAERVHKYSAPNAIGRRRPGHRGKRSVRGGDAPKSHVGSSIAHTRQTRSDSLEHSFLGLQACSDYEVTVHAASGSHQAGNETSQVTRTLNEKADPPTDLHTILTTDTAITFTFFAPENRFCATQYKIGYAPKNSGQADEHVTVPNTEFLLEYMTTLHDLLKCTTYVINVSSESAAGPSNVAVLTQATECPADV